MNIIALVISDRMVVVSKFFEGIKCIPVRMFTYCIESTVRDCTSITVRMNVAVQVETRPQRTATKASECNEVAV